MSKICPQCRIELPDNAAFCDNCGYKFPDTNINQNHVNPYDPAMQQFQNNQQAQQIYPQQKMQYNQQYQTPSPYNQTYPPFAGQPQQYAQPAKKSNAPLIIGIIAAVIVLGAGGYFAYTKFGGILKQDKMVASEEGTDEVIEEVTDEVIEETKEEIEETAESIENEAPVLPNESEEVTDEPELLFPAKIDEIPDGMKVTGHFGVYVVVPNDYVVKYEDDGTYISHPGKDIQDNVEFFSGIDSPASVFEEEIERQKGLFNNIDVEERLEPEGYVYTHLKGIMPVDGNDYTVSQHYFFRDSGTWVVAVFMTDGKDSRLDYAEEHMAVEVDYVARPKLSEFDWVDDEFPDNTRGITDFEEIKGYYKGYIRHYQEDDSIQLVNVLLSGNPDKVRFKMNPYTRVKTDGEIISFENKKENITEHFGTFDNGWLLFTEEPAVLDFSVIYEYEDNIYMGGQMTELATGNKSQIAFIKMKP